MTGRAEPQNLVADPARQATASIRGYVYQIYQSIDTWISLRDHERLFLEAAEDFDRHSGIEVTTTQVKDKPERAVTLRSRDILDSIENFLTHVHNNPSSSIRFRFLTTASRGVEAGQPLPMAGLDYWDAAARDLSLVDSLVTFLRTLDLGPRTRQLLERNTNEAIHTKLLSLVSWDTDSKSIEGISATIKDALVVIGSEYGVIPSEAERVLAVALEHVAGMVTRGTHEALTRAGFLRLFENATMERMPRGEAVKLRGLLTQSSATEEPVLRDPLPLMAGALERPQIVSALVARLVENQVVFLHGSTGLGKTALAALVDRKRGRSQWATLRQLDPRATARTLRSISTTIAREASNLNLVLDDLDLAASDQFRGELVRLVFALRRTKGSLLVTTYLPANQTLLEQLWLDERSNVRAEYFTEGDIEELLLGANAPRHLCNSLAHLVRTSTLGHPQLVQAKIRSLSRSGFATPVADVLRPRDNGEMGTELRRRLISEIASQDSRLLLYRLSIAFGTVRPIHALAVGEVAPVIRLAAENLEGLVGPWLEEIGAREFRISPLVSGVGAELLDKLELRKTHAALAQVPLVQQKASPTEFAEAFLHAIASEMDEVLAPFLAQIELTGAVRKQAGLASALQPLLLVAAGAEETAWPSNPLLDSMIRLIQFQTASVLGEFDLAISFARRAVASAWRPTAIPADLVRGTTALQILLDTRVSLPANIAVPLLVEIIRLTETNVEFGAIANTYQTTPKRGVFGLSAAQALFSFQVVRIGGVESLLGFTNELGKIGVRERVHLLNALDPFTASLMVNNSWLHDVQHSRLDVPKAIDCYRRLYDAATVWQNAALARAARIASAVVLDEYGLDQEAALKELALALAEFGETDGGLIIARAKVYFAKKEYARAASDFEASEADSSVEPIDRAFARRNLALCHAHLSNWQSAAKEFKNGVSAARGVRGLTQMAVGLHADCGFAYWKAEQRKESLLALATALAGLAEISVDSDLKSRHVHATVRHVIVYIWQLTGRSVVPEPPAGICSNQEPHPAIANHEIVDLDGAWDLLLEIDERLGSPAGIRERRGEQPRQRMRLMEISARFAAFDRIARGGKGTLADAIPVLLQVFECLPLRQDQASPGSGLLSREPIPRTGPLFWTLERQVQLSSLIVALGIVSVARTLPIPFAGWRSDLANGGAMFSAVEMVLQAMESGGSMDVDDAILRGSRAIGLLRSRTLLPRDLFACHFSLLNTLQFDDAAALGGYALAELVLSWRAIAIDRRAELLAPNLTCPVIISACDDTDRRGRNKAASVLLAVAPAVGMRLSAETLRMLEKLRSGPQVELS